MLEQMITWEMTAWGVRKDGRMPGDVRMHSELCIKAERRQEIGRERVGCYSSENKI